MIPVALIAASLLPGSIPGRVVFAGEGAVLDAKVGTGLGAEARVVLDLSEAPSKDPLSAAGPPRARFEVRADAGDAREVVDAVLAAPCVVLAGGEALDWFHRLFPRGHASRLAAALREAHAGGATIVGAGASAPYLASWAMVAWSDLGKARRNPRHVREDVAVRGLGLVEGFLVESAARPRGDPARALRAAFDGFLDTLVDLEGAAVLVADPEQRSAEILGAGSVLFFDLHTARRRREGATEGRLSILAPGDRWTRRSGPECVGSEVAADVPSGPELDRLRAAFERASGRFEVHADERTRARDGTACADLEFDVSWDPSGS